LFLKYTIKPHMTKPEFTSRDDNYLQQPISTRPNQVIAPT